MSDPAVVKPVAVAPVARAAYVTPVVQRLGRLNDLTLGAGATTTDAGTKRKGL